MRLYMGALESPQLSSFTYSFRLPYFVFDTEKKMFEVLALIMAKRLRAGPWVVALEGVYVYGCICAQPLPRFQQCISVYSKRNISCLGQFKKFIVVNLKNS